MDTYQSSFRRELKGSMWRIFYYAISIIAMAGLQLDRGVSLRMLAVELFFVCVFGVLAVTIDLILGRECDTPNAFVDSVRPAIFVQFFLLGVATINISDLLTVPQSYGRALFTLGLFAAVALPSLLIVKATMRRLAGERESTPRFAESE